MPKNDPVSALPAETDPRKSAQKQKAPDDEGRARELVGDNAQRHGGHERHRGRRKRDAEAETIPNPSGSEPSRAVRYADESHGGRGEGECSRAATGSLHHHGGRGHGVADKREPSRAHQTIQQKNPPERPCAQHLSRGHTPAGSGCRRFTFRRRSSSLPRAERPFPLRPLALRRRRLQQKRPHAQSQGEGDSETGEGRPPTQRLDHRRNRHAERQGAEADTGQQNARCQTATVGKPQKHRGEHAIGTQAHRQTAANPIGHGEPAERIPRRTCQKARARQSSGQKQHAARGGAGQEDPGGKMTGAQAGHGDGEHQRGLRARPAELGLQGLHEHRPGVHDAQK